MFLDQVPFSKIVEIRDRLLTQNKPYRLESGDPGYDIPIHVKEALNNAISDNFTHYTDSSGISGLKEAIISKLISFNNYKAQSENIFITNGGMHALFTVFTSILQTGDEVLVPTPNWIGSTNIIKATGGDVVEVPFTISDGFMNININNLESFCSPKTKAILLNSPHNPTGSVLSKNKLEQLIDWAKNKDIYIISDEAYEHITFDGFEHLSPSSLSDYHKIIAVHSFSKSFAMSGLRLGHIVTFDKNLYSRIKKTILYTSNGINSITQIAGIAALLGPSDHLEYMKKDYVRKRDLLVNTFNNLRGMSCHSPMGAFYIWAKVDSDGEEFADKLISRKVGVIPGKFFGGDENELRFAFSCETDHILGACEVLKEILPQKILS